MCRFRDPKSVEQGSGLHLTDPHGSKGGYHSPPGASPVSPQCPEIPSPARVCWCLVSWDTQARAGAIPLVPSVPEVPVSV